MGRTELARYLLGYLVGFFIFFLAIPYGLWSLADALADHGWSHLPLPNALCWVLAAGLGLLGLLFALWSNLDLLRKGQGGPTDLLDLTISPRTKKLVVSGAYAHTRNPMVFGMLSVYLGLAIYLDSWPALLAVAAFALAVRRHVLMGEEKRLLRDFGAQYEDYRSRVPMILPRPFQKNP